MWLSSAEFYKYRNIQLANIELSKGLNFLVGENGQGKTNFIEGLYLCLSGDKFRYGENSDLVSFDEKNSSVGIEIKDFNVAEVRLKIENGQKNHFLDGKKINPKKLSLNFPLLLFSPESLAIIKDGDVERRDFVDQFLSSWPNIKYQQLVDNYSKVLRTRNKVLKNIINSEILKEQGIKLLDSYESLYLELASQITFLRINAINSIEFDFKSIAAELYPRKMDISIEYRISDKNATHYNSVQIYDAIKNRLYELKLAELSVGHSLVGPQKHDIKFLINKKDSRIFYSQGQQRSLILAFKLAELMYHRRVFKITPILFLDDVLSELDGKTRENLVKILKKSEGQIFITTTDQYLGLDLFDHNPNIISVSDGKFSNL